MPGGAVDRIEYALMDAAEAGMWWYRALHARVMEALDAAPPGPLLDAGCGTGGLLVRLRAEQPGRPALGLDFDPPAAARAAAKSAHPVAVGSVNALPFPEARFAAEVSCDVLGHAGVDPGRAMAEMARVLRPGGLLVLNLPAFEWLRSAHDARVHNARRFTAPAALRLAGAAGLRPLRARYWNSLLLPLMVAHRKLRARAPDHGSDVAPFSPWLDRTLHAATVLEQGLARRGLAFPAGGSILLTAVRP